MREVQERSDPIHHHHHQQKWRVGLSKSLWTRWDDDGPFCNKQPHCGWLYGGLAGWLAGFAWGTCRIHCNLCRSWESRMSCCIGAWKFMHVGYVLLLSNKHLLLLLLLATGIYLSLWECWMAAGEERGVKKQQSGLWHLDIEVHSSAYIFCTRWSRPASDELKSVHNWKGLSGHMHDDARYVPYTGICAACMMVKKKRCRICVNWAMAFGVHQNHSSLVLHCAVWKNKNKIKSPSLWKIATLPQTSISKISWGEQIMGEGCWSITFITLRIGRVFVLAQTIGDDAQYSICLVNQSLRQVHFLL